MWTKISDLLLENNKIIYFLAAHRPLGGVPNIPLELFALLDAHDTAKRMISCTVLEQHPSDYYQPKVSCRVLNPFYRHYFHHRMPFPHSAHMPKPLPYSLFCSINQLSDTLFCLHLLIPYLIHLCDFTYLYFSDISSSLQLISSLLLSHSKF